MKHMNQLFMLCLVMMCTYTSKAQDQNMNRTELFRNTSQRVISKVMELDKAFLASPGTLIKLQFKNFNFEGTLTSSEKHYTNLHSVLIKSSTLGNTLFFQSLKERKMIKRFPIREKLLIINTLQDMN